MAGARQHFRIQEIAPGVHAAVATAEGFGLCNAGIVDLGGVSLVFDAMLTPQAGEALGIAARRLTGRPVDYLVNSHYHGDHVRGNGAVASRHIVSTHKVRELVLERAAGALESDRAEAAGELEGLRSGRIPATPADLAVYEGWYEGILATPAGWAVVPPDLTISEEFVIHGSRREARVLSFGGGHSPSDVLVHLPAEGIVFLGDLLSVGFHPCLWDGDPEALVRILGRVRALHADQAVPGHGPLGGPRELGLMEGYVGCLQRLAREARAEGSSEAEISQTPPPAPYDAWKFAPFFHQNLAFVAARSARTTPG
ncbi:MAG: MBL fold metallo-hydrolase [Thermoplasmata archaeon]